MPYHNGAENQTISRSSFSYFWHSSQSCAGTQRGYHSLRLLSFVRYELMYFQKSHVPQVYVRFFVLIFAYVQKLL